MGCGRRGLEREGGEKALRALGAGRAAGWKEAGGGLEAGERALHALPVGQVGGLARLVEVVGLVEPMHLSRWERNGHLFRLGGDTCRVAQAEDDAGVSVARVP